MQTTSDTISTNILDQRNSTTKPTRYWEIDTVRGVAIILMVFYHLMWDLNYFGVVTLNMLSGPWQWFARSIATMFIVVLGISLVVSTAHSDRSRLFPKFFLRGTKIFGLGLIITMATYFFLGQGFVIFGILHLLGFSIVAAYPFMPYSWRYLTLITGLILIGLGIYLDSQVSSTPWLIWLGLKQSGRFMVDYYPVLPWFGLALVGVYVGHTLYANGVSRLILPDKSQTLLIRELSFLGRHSLLIYIVHQPLLIGLLILLGVGAV